MRTLVPPLLDVNGITLSLYSSGPTQCRPHWLLHGLPECWLSWREQIPVLAAYTLTLMSKRISQLESHILANCGYWLRSEQAGQANHHLQGFLTRYYPAKAQP